VPVACTVSYDPYVYIACFEFMHALVYFNTITFNNTKSQYSITENMYSSGVVKGPLLGATLNYTEPLRQEFPPVYMAL
jgi:hypothetical protein